MTELKIVLSGCGGISNHWFEGIRKVPDISMVGLVDLNACAATRKKEGHQLGQARVGTDLAAMIRETRPDIVFDCTVPEARASVVETALKLGCHVLSEKPMAASMEEAHRLVAIARETNRLFAVMQNRRYDPRIRALRSFIQSEKLGALTTLNGDFYTGPHFGGFRDRMRHVLLLDMAIHSFDQARLISGADPLTVFCHEWNPRGSWYERDASAIALFEMSNGIVYTYRGSWCAEGMNTSWECDWRAVATRGSVTWDGADEFRAQVVEKEEDPGFTRAWMDIPVPVPELSLPGGHAGCIHDFIGCVRTGRVPETVCTENIKSLAMVFGAIASAESGRRVSIDLPGARA